MKCKNCGFEADGAFCPQCGATMTEDQVPVIQKRKKPVYKKWWFWVLMGLATLITIAIIGGGGDSSTETGTEPPQQDTSVSQPVETPSTEESTEPEKEESNVYRVGDTIDAKGLKLTFQKAEKWESSNMFLQPEDGMEYIRIYIVAENTSSVDRYVFSSDFSCYADNVKMDEEYLAGENTFLTDSISSGRRTEGYFYFSVPVDAKEIEIEYETSWWTDKKAVLKVEF